MQQSNLANKLKEVLSKMSQDEFDKEWSKVTSLNLESPSFEDAINHLNSTQEKTNHE